MATSGQDASKEKLRTNSGSSAAGKQAGNFSDFVPASLIAARKALRAKQMEEYATERLRRLHHGHISMMHVIVYLVLMLTAHAVCGPSRVSTYAAPRGEEELRFAIFAGGGLTLFFTVMVLRSIVDRHTGEIWRRGLTDLVLPFGGMAHPDKASWTRWLNAHWPAPFAPRSGFLPTDGNFHNCVAASGHTSNFPVLVFVGPRLFPSRRILEVYLAAWISGVSDGGGHPIQPTPEGASARTWLADQGFSVRVCEAGVYATADASAKARFCRDPSGMRDLAPVVTALGGFAASIGAEPTEPVA